MFRNAFVAIGVVTSLTAYPVLAEVDSEEKKRFLVAFSPQVLDLAQKYEAAKPHAPEEAFAAAIDLITAVDEPELRLEAARLALELGKFAEVLALTNPLLERLALEDPLRTEAHDLQARSYEAMGDQSAALLASLAAYNSLEARLGPENPVLAERLEALSPKVTALRPDLAPALAQMQDRLKAAASAPPAAVRSEGKPTAVTVWYGTDRAPIQEPGLTDPAQTYGSERGSLSTGKLTVTIPPNHLAGMIERPEGWFYTDHLDPNKHVVLADVLPMAQEAFREGCCASGDRLLFIHGYNVTFHDGALRAAQLSHDLEFDGSMLYYSWPSKASTTGYLADAAGVTATRPALISFLDLATSDQAEGGKLHILAHSMGNRYMLEALEVFLLSNPGRKIGKVVLAAPDVDPSDFEARLPVISAHAEGVTVYASKNDYALEASYWVNGARRLGDSNAPSPKVDMIEYVDASLVEADFLGHSYFGDAGLVMGDILGIVRNGAEAAKRCALSQSGGSGHWDIRLDGCDLPVVRTATSLIRRYGDAAPDEAMRRHDREGGDKAAFWQDVMALLDHL